MSVLLPLAAALRAGAGVDPFRIEGRVVAAGGLTLEIEGLAGLAARGDRIAIDHEGGELTAEVTDIGGARVRAVGFEALEGLRLGAAARLLGPATLAPCDSWLGRVIDPFGRPIDALGALPPGSALRPLRAAPPPAGMRARLGPRLDLGVRALDAFCTCRQGQRLGLFAASGVGKSTLMAMLAQGAEADVAVFALVGERGRELREFIEDDLGPEGMARSVVVCATSDAPPLMRREAAFAAMAVAEHFRDAGKHVLLMMDSLTRFAMALREIGLAAGEPPTTRGYTPSVFAELPRLLERAGPGLEGQGTITGLFTVLVEGDDHDEPVADAVRGILDGHVVLDRRIGEGGRYPAIDVLRSLSRTVPGCLSHREAALMQRARRALALHAEVADLVRLGAYRTGADAAVDAAVAQQPRIEAFLAQPKGEVSNVALAFAALAEVMDEA
jgi:flagellum-specific ATP synthase